MVERGTALLRKMEISVAEAEKRTGKNTVNMQETYTVYLIEIRYVWQQRIRFPASVCVLFCFWKIYHQRVLNLYFPLHGFKRNSLLPCQIHCFFGNVRKYSLFVFACWQASWKCPRRDYACRTRHFVETLQRVWTAQNVPSGHVPLHHHPSTTRETG